MTDKLSLVDPFPKSPLLYNPNTISSSHLLPPLKFHTGLLTPHSVVGSSLNYQHHHHDDDYNESVASVSDYASGNLSEEEEKEEDGVGLADIDIDYLEKPVMQCYKEEEEEEMFGPRRPGPRTKLNRGLLKEDLKIEVPDNFRRFTTDGELGFRKSAFKNSTAPGGSFSLRERVQMHNAHVVFNLCFIRLFN